MSGVFGSITHGAFGTMTPHNECPGAVRPARGVDDPRKGTDMDERNPFTYPPHIARYYDTVLERFWAQVEIGDDCWPWKGHCGSAGYGMYRIGHRKSVSAHRFSLELSTGDQVPAAMYVCHRCDNPPCVRPEHLFVGSPADNTHDMVSKGRGGNKTFPGESSPNAKLSESDVLLIRAIPARISHRVVAEQFNISVTLAGKVRRREAWRHVA